MSVNDALAEENHSSSVSDNDLEDAVSNALASTNKSKKVEKVSVQNAKCTHDLSTVKAFLWTFGCAHNKADTDRAGSILVRAGATIVSDPRKANFHFINSCTVKNPSEEKAWTCVRQALTGTINPRKYLEDGISIESDQNNLAELVPANKVKAILAGCVPQSCEKFPNDITAYVSEKRLSVIGIASDYFDIVSIVGTLMDCPLLDAGQQKLQADEISNEANIDLRIKSKSDNSNDGNVGNKLKRVTAKAIMCGASMDFPIWRSTPYVDVIPLCTGCLGHCTYCKTVQSRGRLQSHSLQEIEARVKAALNDPQIVELWLTGEDTLAWGRENKSDFEPVLQKIVDLIEESGKKGVMARIGMTDPESIIGKEEKLCKFLVMDNFYKFLHLPVQSGSDNVLKAMRRDYTIKQYTDSIKKIRDLLHKAGCDVSISTDIICGFPGETDEDFEQTLELLRTEHFEVINITQYYARRGTLAAKMQQVDPQVKKQRTKESATVSREAFKGTRSEHVGEEYRIVVTEKLKEYQYEREYAGKSPNYLSVLIENPKKVDFKIGDYIRVRVTGQTAVSLVAEAIEIMEAGPVTKLK